MMRGFPDRTITSRGVDGGIRADQLVREVGATKLVGKRVMTPAMGNYPGGPATIIKVGEDPNAREIAFTVKHDTWHDDICDDGIIGVFNVEIVKLIALQEDV